MASAVAPVQTRVGAPLDTFKDPVCPDSQSAKIDGPTSNEGTVVISLKRYEELLAVQKEMDAMRAQKELVQADVKLSRLSPKEDTSNVDNKILFLTQDITALKIGFAGELDRLREEFRQDLKHMEKRLENRLSCVESSKDSLPPKSFAVKPVRLTELPVNQGLSSSFFWSSNDFMDADCDSHEAYSAPFANSTVPSLQHLPSSLLQPSPLTSPCVTPAEVPSTQRLTTAKENTDPMADDSRDSSLVQLAVKILSEYGSVPIGRMGSMMHKAARDHTLPSLLKERYGGLKKFLQCHEQHFVVGADHPYNPHVRLHPHHETKLTSSAAPLTIPKNPNVISALLPPIQQSLEQDGGKGSGRKRTKIRKREKSFENMASDPCSSLTPTVALDCQMVGVGPDGSRSALARCTVVVRTSFVQWNLVCFVVFAVF